MTTTQVKLPDFLIIGAAKSGTTTLYRYLCQHPQIFMPACKEPAFFAFDDVYARGIDWYASLFQEAQPHQICGEASTDYTKLPRWSQTAERIARHLPQVKMIYLMRNPIDRAYSYYVHLGRGLKYQETFEEQIKKTSICLDASNYILQIEHYLHFFPKESFLFLLTEDLLQKPLETLQKVSHFLDIDDSIDLTQNGIVIANSGKNWFQDKIRLKITEPIKKIPGVTLIANNIPSTWKDWVYFKAIEPSFYGKKIQKEYKPSPMLPETRQMLIEHFQIPNQKLAHFLDRDLSHWNQ